MSKTDFLFAEAGSSLDPFYWFLHDEHEKQLLLRTGKFKVKIN